MDKNWIVENEFARNAHTWGICGGEEPHKYRINIYVENNKIGAFVGFETESFRGEPLAYIIKRESEKEFPIFEVYATTIGAFERKVDLAHSLEEAQAECIRRARASLELIADELTTFNLNGSVTKEDRTTQRAA